MADFHELLASYDYQLPLERIAQEPCAQRDGARLLVAPPLERAFEDKRVTDLPDLLRSGDLLVFNDTRVRPARLEGVRCATGGRAELLVLECTATTLRGLLKTRGTPAVGERFEFGAGRVVLRHAQDLGDGLHELHHDAGDAFAALLEGCGRMPLPPYIQRQRGCDPRDSMDRERYQTVYAREDGAAAAPTAGLHFTPTLLQQLSAVGVQHTFVTLHVGLGTFKPVTAERLGEHVMHAEAYTISAAAAAEVRACRARGGRVIPVGTTALRALESGAAMVAARSQSGEFAFEACSGVTRLFLRPPCAFRCADLLFTNFHAPRSTLFVLVAAWCGLERIHAAYAHALAQQYRFLSYGDACLLSPARI